MSLRGVSSFADDDGRATTRRAIRYVALRAARVRSLRALESPNDASLLTPTKRERCHAVAHRAGRRRGPVQEIETRRS